MNTVFEMIFNQEIPGKFIWADDRCVAIATIEPVAPGHTLVIPREPIPNWTDLPPQLLDHTMRVAQIIGLAARKAFDVPKVGLVVAGFEVPHTHVHLIPAHSEAECSLANAKPAPEAAIADAANALRDTLRLEGYGSQVPMELDSPAVAQS